MFRHKLPHSLPRPVIAAVDYMTLLWPLGRATVVTSSAHTTGQNGDRGLHSDRSVYWRNFFPRGSSQQIWRLYNRVARKRKALAITDTELNDIASAATTGVSRMPNIG